MKNKILPVFYSVIALVTPGVALAADCPPSVRSIKDLIQMVICTLNSLMPIIFVVALIYFLMSALKLVQADDKGRDEARNKIIYGLIGLFVMVSVWGLVNVLDNTFNLNNVTPDFPTYPTLK